MGAFSEGFGMGQNMWNQAQNLNMRQQELDRQARMDEQLQAERDLRMQGLKGDLADKDLARSDKAALRAASKPAVSTEGYGVADADGKISLQPDQATADFAARMSNEEAGGDAGYTATPSVNVSAGANTKSFMRDAGGLASAKEYTAAQNNPDAINARKVAILRSQGADTEANALESGYKKHQTEVYEAGRTALYQRGLESLQKNGPQALVDMYHHYNDGFNASLQMNPDGSGMITQVDKDGKPTGQINFKNNDDLAMQFRNMVYPDKAIDNKIAVSTKIAEERAKQHVLRPGDKIGSMDSGVTSNDDLKPGMTWAVDANGNRYQQPVGKSGSADGKPFKMDEDDKIRLRDVNSRVADAEKLLVEAKGKIMPGDDPKNYPGVAQAESYLRSAKTHQFKTMIQLGQISPGQIVTEILGAAKTDADAIKSLQELNGAVGVEFADQVGDLLSQTDAWKALVAKTTTKAAPEGQSSAPTNQAAKPTPQTPVEPKGRVEYVQAQQALVKGFDPVGRGNGGIFGSDEILYQNRATGEKVWASKLFGK